MSECETIGAFDGMGRTVVPISIFISRHRLSNKIYYCTLVAMCTQADLKLSVNDWRPGKFDLICLR